MSELNPRSDNGILTRRRSWELLKRTPTFSLSPSQSRFNCAALKIIPTDVIVFSDSQLRYVLCAAIITFPLTRKTETRGRERVESHRSNLNLDGNLMMHSQRALVKSVARYFLRESRELLRA